MTKVTIVERPKHLLSPGGKTDAATLAALLETATTGKAVVIPCGDSPSHNVRRRYEMHVRVRGYRFRGFTSRDGTSLTAWVVKAPTP